MRNLEEVDPERRGPHLPAEAVSAAAVGGRSPARPCTSSSPSCCSSWSSPASAAAEPDTWTVDRSSPARAAERPACSRATASSASTASPSATSTSSSDLIQADAGSTVDDHRRSRRRGARPRRRSGGASTRRPAPTLRPLRAATSRHRRRRPTSTPTTTSRRRPTPGTATVAFERDGDRYEPRSTAPVTLPADGVPRLPRRRARASARPVSAVAAVGEAVGSFGSVVGSVRASGSSSRRRASATTSTGRRRRRRATPASRRRRRPAARGRRAGASTSSARATTNRLVSIVGVVRIGADGSASGGRRRPDRLLRPDQHLHRRLQPGAAAPFDGGHVAIATYERIRERGCSGGRYRVDVAKLLPLTYAVVLVLGLLVRVDRSTSTSSTRSATQLVDAGRARSPRRPDPPDRRSPTPTNPVRASAAARRSRCSR